MVLSSILAASLVSFSGGDAGKLAVFLSETAQKTVAVLDRGDVVKPFSFFYDPKNGLPNAVKMHTGLGSKGGFSFYNPTWPDYKMKSVLLPDNLEPTGQIRCTVWPTKSISEFAESEIARYRLSDLGTTFLAKKIDIHWFYQDLVVGLGVKGSNLVELFKEISTAVGAKLVVEGDSISLQLDSKEFRSRTRATILAMRTVVENRSGSGLEVADLDLFAGCLNALSDTELLSLFKTGSKAIKVVIKPNTALMNLVERRLAAFAKRKDISNASELGIYAPSEIAKLIDWDQPVNVSIQPFKIKVLVSAKIKDSDGAVEF